MPQQQTKHESHFVPYAVIVKCRLCIVRLGRGPCKTARLSAIWPVNYWIFEIAFNSFVTTSLGRGAYERDSVMLWPCVSIHFRKSMIAALFA